MRVLLQLYSFYLSRHVQVKPTSFDHPKISTVKLQNFPLLLYLPRTQHHLSHSNPLKYPFSIHKKRNHESFN
ncbi:hypothetical protein L1887_13607 [Cichorium endivia]|nr:hypothetical protein L1887_13607 [Cichorium endivia]